MGGKVRRRETQRQTQVALPWTNETDIIDRQR